ncbi:MAG: GGDEF domain-containing protein [Solirubrobacteraceae bacterium]
MAPVLGNLRNLAVAELRAATDALTGLPNHRMVQETARLMAAQAGRNVTPLAVLALDLDHFKRVNDVYGHGKGDDVLAAVGTALSSAVRDSDFVGRNGGEEFLVLLPDTGQEGTRLAAEKIRERVAQVALPTGERVLTVSVGIALLPEHAADPATLLRLADRALFAAKANGRNRVEVFADDSPILDPAPAVPSDAHV